MQLVGGGCGRHNLKKYLRLADAIDIAESQTAYTNYNRMMRRVSDFYGFPLDLTVAAFCALSPNNDYFGNLRSLVSVLQGVVLRVPPDAITISTYNHCKLRALDYLQGAEGFVSAGRGLKTLSFYQNILTPDTPDWVTIDGHIAAAYNGNPLATMKDSILTRRNYAEISDTLFGLALDAGELPSTMQARVWLTRKRLYRIKFNPNMDMFREEGDQSGILLDPALIHPYPLRVVA